MAFTRLHHVAIVTNDLENARHVYVDGFGLSVDEERTPLPNGRSEQGASILEFPIGEMFIAAMKSEDENSGSGKFFAASGGRGGMYYISIASSDIAADVAGLTGKGVKVEGDWDGKGPVFLDPATTLGLRLQIIPDDDYFAHPYYRGDGTITGMAHVGIAGKSVEVMRNLWQGTFGLGEDKSVERGITPPTGRELGPGEDPVHLVEFPVGGSVIEISVPTVEGTGTARLVESRAQLGGVFHHICPFAPDVHRLVEKAEAAGIQQIGSVRREQGDRVVAWFHPKTCVSTLVEAWNRPPGKEQMSHQHGVTPFPY